MGSLEAEDIETTRTLTNAGSRLTPLRYVRSPTNSPRHQKKQDKGSFYLLLFSLSCTQIHVPKRMALYYIGSRLFCPAPNLVDQLVNWLATLKCTRMGDIYSEVGILAKIVFVFF